VGIDSGVEEFINPGTLATLRQKIAQIRSLLAQDQDRLTIDALQDLKTFVRQQSGVTIPNTALAPGGNIAGALVAGASTLAFSLSLFLPL